MDTIPIRKTQVLSVVDGAFWTLMVAFGETIVLLYLAKVSTSSTLLAGLTTIPLALGAVAQALLPYLFRASRPKDLLLGSVVVQICGMGLMAIGLLNEPFSALPMATGLTVYFLGGMCGGAPWQDLIAHLIPERLHNRFFADRAALLSVVALGCNLLVGLLLRNSLDRRSVFFLLLCAIVFRMASLAALWGHPRPEPAPETLSPAVPAPPSPTPVVGIVWLSTFLFAFRFSVTLSGPFFNPYMVNTLHFSVITILMLSSVPIISRIFLMQNWGTLLDRKLTFEGIVLCMIGTSILPSLWAFSSHLGYLAVLQLVSGLVWPGFDLLSTLLVQRMYPRTILTTFAWYLGAGTAGGALGGLAGGFLLDSGLSYENTFHLSSLLRAFLGLVLLLHLRRSGLFRFRALRLQTGLGTLLSLRESVSHLVRFLVLFKP